MILGTINLRMSRKQTEALRKLWTDYAEGVELCNVIGRATVKRGPSWAEPATVEFHVVQTPLGQRIQQAIEAGKEGGK